MSLSDPYGDPRLAAYFDVTDDYVADIPFYKKLVEPGKKFLELGVGTGRVALALAAQGAAVTGIDISKDMLSIARRKYGQIGEPGTLELIQGDMRSFDLPTTDFDIAYIAEYSFNHLHSITDQQKCLAAVHRHLVAGGLLIVHVFQGNPEYFASMTARGVDRSLVQDCGTFSLANGNILQLSVTSAYRRSRQLLDSVVRYDEVWPDGRLERRVASHKQHVYVRSELELLLSSTGFDVEQVMGSPEGEPFDDQSWDLIAVARKPA